MTESSINVIATDVQSVLRPELVRSSNSFLVASIHEVDVVIRERARGPVTRAVMLDLLGHSTREHQYLRIGTTAIDMLDPLVFELFERIAHERLLQTIGVVGVRLLGCQTAATSSGRRTLRVLARVLGVPVFGTLKRLGKSHYTATGFDPVFHRILVDAARLSPATQPRSGAVDVA